MKPFEESLKEIFLSFLEKELSLEKKTNYMISFTTSVLYRQGDISGCPELKVDNFFLTATYRDGEIVSLTTSASPSIS